MIKGYCAITGDILHVGHIRFIQKCSTLCDELTVGVMTDEAVEKYKNQKPIMPFEEREEIIRNIKGVVRVVKQGDFFKTYDGYEFHRPDLVFDSMEHIGERWPYALHIDRVPNISSTQIKERIIEASRSRKK